MSGQHNDEYDDSEQNALRDRHALAAFCEAQMEIRQLKQNNKEVLTRLRQDQKNSMQALLNLMQRHQVECVGIGGNVDERLGTPALAYPRVTTNTKSSVEECEGSASDPMNDSSIHDAASIDVDVDVVAGREGVRDVLLSSSAADKCEPTAYVRIGKAYTTRELSAPFLRAVLYEHYNEIVGEVNLLSSSANDDETTEAAPVEDDAEGGEEPDVMRVVQVVLKFINKVRTTEKTVVLISKKKPRNVNVTDIGVVNETSVLRPALQTFTRNKTALANSMAEHKEARKGVEARLNNSMGVVQQYMEKHGHTSQAIVLSKFNNQKMLLKCKVVLHKPPVQVSMLRDIAMDVFREVKLSKPVHTQGAWFSAEVLNIKRESIIDNIVTQLTAKRPVFKKSIIKLDKAREAFRNPRS